MQQLWMAVVLLVMAVGSAMVQGAAPAPPTDIVGTWQGQLSPDANTKLNIQFVFSRGPDGGYTAVLSSPDNPALRNVAATGVSFQGGNLRLQVASLSGSYAATLKDGRLEGQWTQPGGNLPLVLSPFQKPQLAKAAMSVLEGAWNGKFTGPAGNSVTLVTRFRTGAEGELVATLAQIEGGGQEIPLSDVVFTDNKLSFRVPRANATFNGTLANGAIAGTFKLPGPGMPAEGTPLTFRRGDVPVPTHPLKLTTSQFATLNGPWEGKLGALTIVMRFETNRDGQFVAFLDSPDQGARGIPVTALTFDGSKLTAQVGQLGQYEGTLEGKTITGTWTQGGRTNPLTLTKR